MNSQIAYRLIHIAQILRDNLPFGPELLTNLLSTGHPPQTSATILRLLCLHNSSHLDSQVGGQDTQLRKLQQIFDCLIPLVETRPPLSFLMHRQFEDFDEYCRENKNQDLMLRSLGLDPSLEASQHSYFSRYRKNEGVNGNPFWYLARNGISLWFKLNDHRLQEIQRQTYAFLLSSPTFMEKSTGLNRLWALLYGYYMQIILDEAWKLQEKQDREEDQSLFWKREDVNKYRDDIMNLENSLSGQSKAIYYLVIGLLPSLDLTNKNNTQNNLLEQSYDSYLKAPPKETKIWHVLALILFMKVAVSKQQTNLASKIKVHLIDSFKKGQLKKFDFFIPLFIEQEELIPLMVAGQINYNDLNLSYQQKRNLIQNMLLEGKLNQDLLQYLEPKHMEYIFTKANWSLPKYGYQLLPLINKNKDVFINKLSECMGESDLTVVQKQLDIFLEAWDSYYQVIQQVFPDLILLTKVSSISKKTFRKEFQDLLVPLSYPSFVCEILQGYARYFDHHKEQMKNRGPALKLFKLFQDTELQGLLTCLNQDQKNDFWKQWGELLRCDPDFVEDALRPPQTTPEKMIV